MVLITTFLRSNTVVPGSLLLPSPPLPSTAYSYRRLVCLSREGSASPFFLSRLDLRRIVAVTCCRLLSLAVACCRYYRGRLLSLLGVAASCRYYYGGP